MSLAIWGAMRLLFTLPSPSPETSAGDFNQPNRVGKLMQISHSPQRKPLRIARVQDQPTRRGCAGRMVISGRMDEVCAELDRLVRQEALAMAQH